VGHPDQVIPLATERFEAYSGQHYALLLLTVVGALVVVWFGRRYRDTRLELVVRRSVAAAALTFVLAMQLFVLTPDVRSARTSWPLDLSDIADYTAVFALWTLGLRSSAITYYVGLSLTLMAILTPSLGQSFPDPRWFGFWGRHIVVVWAAVYLVWGLGFRPTWRLLRATLWLVLAWVVVVSTFNRVMDTNYGYLVHTPAASTPLDWFGPWPFYLLAAAAVLIGLWALVFTWPWVRAARTKRAGSSAT
jgi:hypothetical integral membrane protein (TIGR02206 family)